MYDFIVIGSGIAGLYFSLLASKSKVLLLTKSRLTDSNTDFAQGGLAAVLDHDNDSLKLHVQDTVIAGAGINKKRAVRRHVKTAPQMIHELLALGVGFESFDGKLKLTKEAGHSVRRIVYSKDNTGHAVEKVLAEKVRKAGNIIILENCMAIDLIRQGRTCAGVMYLKGKKVECAYSKFTILATGGAGQLYSNSTNSKVATGDGYALAKRAGAVLTDLEFVQFHPTKFLLGEEPILISETVRGEGGILKDINGAPFMDSYHHLGNLAPRDIVSRAIITEMEKSNSSHVYLDISHMDADFVKNRFPNIYKRCLKFSIDITKQPIPVQPAAHYMCGGVKTDLNGSTSIRGLYAIGEVACTGLHGANRLASNSMMEALVIGQRAYRHSMKSRVGSCNEECNSSYKFDTLKTDALKNRIREIMDTHAGIVRTEKGLWEGLRKINELNAESMMFRNRINKDIVEARNMLIVSREIIKAAIRRKKSVGCHFIIESSGKNI